MRLPAERIFHSLFPGLMGFPSGRRNAISGTPRTIRLSLIHILFGSMGVTTNLFPAMTLGSITAGVGITSDSVSPMNLIYVRNVGYGVREIEDRMAGDAEERNGRADAAVLSTTCQTAVPKGGDDSLDDELERAMKKLLEWMAEEE